MITYFFQINLFSSSEESSSMEVAKGDNCHVQEDNQVLSSNKLSPLIIARLFAGFFFYTSLERTVT